MARVKQLADKDGELIYPVVDPTQLHFSGTEKQVVKGDGTIGVPQYVKQLEGNGRIASADITHQYDNDQVHQRLDISSSSMTTGKPAADGFINTYMWDNSGTYDTQVYIPNGETINNGGMPQIRFRGGNANWGSWKNIITSSSSGSVTSGMLADNAVTKNKISFSTLKPRWDLTYTTNTDPGDVTWSKTTLGGTTITLHQCNGGTGLMIDSGGSAFKIIRHNMAFDANSFTASAIGVHNIATGSAIWARFSGITNGTQKNFQQVQHTGESGVNYGTIIDLNATTTTSGSMEYTISRIKGNTFSASGSLHIAGNNTSVFFTAEITAKDVNSIPTLYLRGTGSSITNVIHSIEILEV